jgi:hypothetical protein
MVKLSERHRQSREYALKIRHEGITAGWEQWYFLMSDAHWDAPECYLKLLHEHLGEAVDRNALVIDAGDFYEVISGAGDPRSSKGTIREEHVGVNYLDRLVDDGVDEFSPYLNNYVYMGTGNHEQAVTIRKETDITQRFVDKANGLRGALPPIHRAGYTGWIRFMFEAYGARTSHAMKIEHGTGGNSPVTKGIQTARRSSRTEGVTFFVSGHIHEKWCMPLVTETLNPTTSRVELREVNHIQCGSYKMDFRLDGTATWAQMKMGNPKPIGGYWLRFFLKDGHSKRIQWEVLPAQVDYANIMSYLRKTHVQRESLERIA